VTLAATRDVRLNAAAHLPELTYTATDVQATDGETAARSLDQYLSSHSSVLIGPGLGRGGGTTAFVADLLRRRPREHGMVIDADGLVALSEIPEWWSLLGPNAVLTPHSGELERLVGHELSSDEPLWVQAGRLAQRWGCLLIAKGPFTSIAAADGRVAVWPRANSALATGGTGDVLAGACAGLLAQRISAWDAGRLAVGVHGLTAERIIEARRWRTLLAGDLLSELPATLGSIAAATGPR
jgi:NAD(P)H-hydrate epimerase